MHAQIEKELLTIVFPKERFHTYVYGRQFTVGTDHKPLTAIVKQSLASVPKKLQKVLLRLRKHNYKLVYRPGTQTVIADTLSRAA